MKTVTRWFRTLLVGGCFLAANAFAGYFFSAVGSAWAGPTYDSGTVYSVPAGANYEWEVHGSAVIGLGGAGFNVYEYGTGSYKGDVGNTPYADNISYSLNAYDYYNGYALLYLGW